MNRLPLLPLAVPFACLALLSLVAFLGVVRAIKSGLGQQSSDGDPWQGMVGDAHPLDYVEAPR
jgi:hypothetical protein